MSGDAQKHACKLYESLICLVPLCFFFLLSPRGLTLQQPVDLAVVGQPLQRRRHGRQVEPVLLQGLVAAVLRFDGPLRRGGSGGECERDNEQIEGKESSQETAAELTGARLTDAAPRMTTSGLSDESCIEKGEENSRKNKDRLHGIVET